MKSIAAAKTETKFKSKDLISCSAFGRLIDCSPQAARKLLYEKLTEGVSYLKDGNKILIDIECAKKELRANVKPRTCKNERLLEFLDFPNLQRSSLTINGDDDISKLDPQQVREELAKSELRLSLMQEDMLHQKYIDRALVEKNLNLVGIEIKKAFSGMSATITPLIMAAKTDREAENLLNKFIEDKLMALSNLGNSSISVK